MKSSLLLPLLLLVQVITAQTFTEVPQSSLPIGIPVDFIACADINGDTYPDLLITGQDSTLTHHTKLYTNDGLGNFTEMIATPFRGVVHSAQAFADVNGDSYLDVLIIGQNDEYEPSSQLYINDGVGNFTEASNTPFAKYRDGFVAFADVNGDSSPDALLTGRNPGGPLSTRLYINDGSGNFTERANTPFPGIVQSSMAFADVNGDTHLDVLIAGRDSTLVSVTKLYTNDGAGNFTEIEDNPFLGVSYSAIAFADVNSDTHLDVLITGVQDGALPITKLYVNDGLGNFTDVEDASFEEVAFGSIAFADVNDDSHVDVLITGLASTFGSVTKIYTNDGIGNFTEMPDTPFESVIYSSSLFRDLNGDSSPDVLITGFINSTTAITKLYLNSGVVNPNDEQLEGNRLELTPFPNPVVGKQLRINYHATVTGPITIKVYDLSGRQLSQQKEIAAIGQQFISVSTEALAKGTYLIEVNDGSHKSVARFVVQ